jgi:hypothetical protein
MGSTSFAYIFWVATQVSITFSCMALDMVVTFPASGTLQDRLSKGGLACIAYHTSLVKELANTAMPLTSVMDCIDRTINDNFSTLFPVKKLCSSPAMLPVMVDQVRSLIFLVVLRDDPGALAVLKDWGKR